MTLTTLPAWFEGLELKKGGHDAREQGMCAMEAAAYLAGRAHSDRPPCVCPVIGAFLRNWNDNLPDESRTRLLKPLLPGIIGTKSTAAVEERRSYMALDWFIREHVPAWFDLTPSLKPSGGALRALDEINARAAAEAAGVVVSAARDAAWDAARAAARDAAGAAAWDAAGAAAWDAARAAAGDAARDAAGAAAWAAAWAAARAAAGAAAGAAARDAARDAAGAALKPTAARLQASACDLVRRMCAVKP